MVAYRLQYIDKEGKQYKKVMELSSEEQLQEYIDVMDINILKVESLPSYYKLLSPGKLFERITMQQVIEILENLHVIVRSGLSLNTAILDLAKDADNAAIANMLTDISYSIEMSSSLSEAMGKYEKVFGETTIGLVKIGEETGELDNTIKDATEYLKRIADLRSKLKSALIVPIFTLVAMIGAFTFWMVFVMPDLIAVFESFEIELPAVTKGIIAADAFVRQYTIQIPVAVVSIIIAFFVLRRKNKWFLELTDRYILKLPIIGVTLRYYNYAFVAEYTRLMVASGLPLFQALGILADSLRNTIFKNSIINTRDAISSGQSFSAAVSEQKMFTPLVTRMISVGEQTGRLESQLEYVSQYYYNKVDHISENIARLIQPILTVVLGAFLILIMVGFLLPISDMVTSINK